MKLIDQSVAIIYPVSKPLEVIERAGRTCYKSEDKITPDSAARFVERILKRGHESVIEHLSVTANVREWRHVFRLRTSK